MPGVTKEQIQAAREADLFRKDVYGSDKEYSFCYPPRNPGSRHVAVFEAPIDALSHGCLYGKRAEPCQCCADGVPICSFNYIYPNRLGLS